AAGNWTCTLTVTDNAGTTGSASVVVTVTSLALSANLVGNSSFEASTAGWTPERGPDAQRVPGGHDGNYSAELYRNAGSTGPLALGDAPPSVGSTAGPGTVYRFSAWVKS